MKNTDELVGTCGYYRGYVKNSGEISYLLKISHRGLGIMKEAVKLIVNFGFDFLKLNSAVAYTNSNNPASIAVLENAGFKKAENANKPSSISELKFEHYNR